MIIIDFEISISGQEPIVSASDNLIFVALSYGYFSDRIVVKGGYGLHHLTRLAGKPENGDKVLVIIIGMDKVSPVLVMEEYDGNEIKERYEQLKIRLQERTYMK